MQRVPSSNGKFLLVCSKDSHVRERCTSTLSTVEGKLHSLECIKAEHCQGISLCAEEENRKALSPKSKGLVRCCKGATIFFSYGSFGVWDLLPPLAVPGKVLEVLPKACEAARRGAGSLRFRSQRSVDWLQAACLGFLAPQVCVFPRKEFER